MRKLYDEFFHIPKQGKIREKVMLMRTALTVVIMLFCLAAISITAFARFSYNVTSHTTTIKAVVFQADIGISVTEEISTPVVVAAAEENDTAVDTVAEEESTAADDDTKEKEVKKEYHTSPVPVTVMGSGIYTADLEAGKVYTITLSKSAESSASTGFCVITATGCQDTYHTQQLGADAGAAGGYRADFSFELKVTADTTLTILSHWGTSSHYADEGDRLYITDANTGDNMVVVSTGTATSVSADDKSAETEKVTEEITKETEESTTVAEKVTEASTETEKVTEKVTEASTETEKVTEKVTEASTETEKVTEKVTEASTETEKVTEKVTEASTETEKVTEKVTEAPTDTEKVTETEEITDAVTTEIEETTTEIAETSEPETTELVTQAEETEAVEEETTEEQVTEPTTEEVSSEDTES